jgi:hypothetical protein
MCLEVTDKESGNVENTLDRGQSDKRMAISTAVTEIAKETEGIYCKKFSDSSFPVPIFCVNV